MKAKTKKILAIIIVILVVLAILSGVICWFVIPEQLKEFGLSVWQFVNEPLPIVGVSLLMVLVFAWRIFASTSFGRKQLKKVNAEFNRVKAEVEAAKNERLEFENNVRELLESREKEIAYLKEIIARICKASPNKNVKLLGEKVYGRKEENDGSTETKDL